MNDAVIKHFQILLSVMENRQVSELEVEEFLLGYEEFETRVQHSEPHDNGLH